MTLALLITAVGGAWAQDIATPVISGETEFYDEVTVTITCATSDVDIYYTLDGSDPRGDHPAQIDYKNAFTLTETTTVKAAAYSGDCWSAIAEVTFTKQTGPKVTWDAATKTGTFYQPGSDVVLTPQYAPTAAWAEVESVKQLPAAAEGVIAGTDAPLIVEGIVAFAGTSTEVTQGTVMYAVTPATANEAPALTAFSADVPTAKNNLITDDGAEVKVWYYILGADAPDGETPTADNTFNDSEVSSLNVSVRSNKFDLALKAANANTIEAGKATVTVGGQPATVTDGKLQGVKMGSEVKMTAKEGYKFRKVEVKKTGSAVLAPALENGATVVIICNWGEATTTFTYTNNGGTFSGQASGFEAGYFHNGLELNGKNLSFGASNMDNSEYLSVGITFNTESSAYSYTGKGENFVSFTISVNGTDVTDQLSELK